MELSGIVLTEDGSAVPYATIVARFAHSDAISGTISDEAGRFALSLFSTPDSIFFQCLGYEDRLMAFSEVGDTIVMSPQAIAVDEVVVKGDRPAITLKGGTVGVDIRGSVLGHESSVSDVLRKIPGLVSIDDAIRTVDGYTPSYYLNGRKVSSLSEIRNIDVSTIKSVELITSPGARYSSNERAVVIIRTTTPLDGTSLSARSYLRLNHRFTHGHSFDFSVKNNSFLFFGSAGYSDYRKRTHQDLTYRLSDGSSSMHAILEGVYSSNKEVDYSFGTEYFKEGNWGCGIRYNGSWEKSNDHMNAINHVEMLSSADSVNSDNDITDKHLTHHVNGYVQKEWDDRFFLNLYLDFYMKGGDRNQSNTERSTLSGDRFSEFSYGSTNAMYSAKPVFEWKILENLSAELGGDFFTD